jgi:hypothetical protein
MCALGGYGWQRGPRVELSSGWATAKLLVQAQVLSQQDDQCGAVKARQ